LERRVSAANCSWTRQRRVCRFTSTAVRAVKRRAQHTHAEATRTRPACIRGQGRLVEVSGSLHFFITVSSRTASQLTASCSYRHSASRRDARRSLRAPAAATVGDVLWSRRERHQLHLLFVRRNSVDQQRALFAAAERSRVKVQVKCDAYPRRWQGERVVALAAVRIVVVFLVVVLCRSTVFVLIPATRWRIEPPPQEPQTGSETSRHLLAHSARLAAEFAFAREASPS
jgi:hypothetical protein